MSDYIATEYRHKLERELHSNMANGNIKLITVEVSFFRDEGEAAVVTDIMVTVLTHDGKHIKIPADVKNFPQPELIAKLELLA